MMVISGLGENGLDEVKEFLSSHININKRGNDVVVFSAGENLVTKVKAKFVDAKITIEDSDQKIYQNAFKIQSALNLKKFKAANKELKGDSPVMLMIRGHPMESFTDENAIAFAQYVAKCYTPNEEHKLKFNIRGWLMVAFKKMLEEKLLISKAGKPIEQFGFFVSRNPIQFPRDKCILAKFFAPLNQVDAIVKTLSEFERAPNCQFLNPATFEDRKQKYADRDEKKKEYLNKKKAEKTDKPKEKREPKEKAEGEKPKYVKKDKPEGEKPKAPFIKMDKKPFVKREKKENIDIQIEDKKPKIKTFLIPLEQFPEGAGQKIVEALKAKVPKGRIYLEEKSIRLTCLQEEAADVKATLNNVSVNKTNIKYNEK